MRGMMISRLSTSPSGSRSLRITTFALVTGLALFACDTTDEVEDEVLAPEGPTQPAGDGNPISESLACGRLTAAFAEANTRLSCSESAMSCPDFFRASNPPCLQYDEGSINGCVSAYGSAGSCEQVALGCIAISMIVDPSCVSPNMEGGADAGDGGDAATEGGVGEAGADSSVDSGSMDASSDAMADSGGDATDASDAQTD